MSTTFYKVLVGVLAVAVVVLGALCIYQRIQLEEQAQVIHFAIRFIQSGCPFSQLH